MDRDLILYLNAIGIPHQYMEDLLEHFGSYENLCLRNGDYGDIDLPPAQKRRLTRGHKSFNLDDYRERLWKEGAKVTTVLDDNFPESLKRIPDAPYLLYYKGDLNPVFQYGIGVVGARKCTNYGAWACEEIAGSLSSMGIPVISGLALGIDKIAHQAALDRKNYTLAVLGTGIDIEYPASNRSVYNRFRGERKACIVSEYPPGTRAGRHTFPFRNRIISGLGLGLVVIEARKKSGTLITARYGAEQGKEVFAVPGNINSLYSKGTNALIRDGAKIITGIEDILIELPRLKELTETDDGPDPEELSDGERRVYNALKEFPKHPDQLTFELNYGINEVMLNLTKLEMKGYIKQLGDKFSV